MRLLPLTFATTALSATIFSNWLENIQQAIAIDTQPKSLEQEIISLHKDIVTINSVSGGEGEVGEYLADYLQAQGFTVETQLVSEGRLNVYAYYGSKRDTKVLLTSHIDTVPPYLPYYIHEDRIYGRGSADAKASVAAMVMAARSLHAEGSIEDGDLSLLFVVGEEYDGAGMKYASDNLGAEWDHAVFGEPTELKLGVGHKGMFHFDVNVTGKASHSGYPYLGIDANKKIIDILYQIEHAEFPSDPLLGNTTVNVGLINAGVAGNVISPIANARCIIRVAHDAKGVSETVIGIIDEANKEYDNVKLISKQYEEPVYLDYEVPGFDTIILAYYTDIPNLKRTLKSRYLYGPGSIHVAHGADEYVTIGDLKAAIGGYKKLTKFLLEQ